MKTILITGGAGFIGSHLCQKYLESGFRVIAVDNLQTTGSTKNIRHLLGAKNFRFIKHDIIEPLRIQEHVDWIFNFACAGSYTSYQYDPIHTIKTNTLGVINMLELAKSHGARILQASTSEIYGDPLEIPQAESYLGNVNMLGPRACYDEGKRLAETIFMDYHREYDMDVKIVRIFNTYGPRMDINDGRAITNFVINALAGRDLIIYGDGSHTRSFQYIDDLIEGIDKMMNQAGFTGPVNLGNPGEITMLALAKLVIKKTQAESNIIFTKKASDDPKRRCPAISLAQEKLVWYPRISLDEGLDKTIAYFKNAEKPDQKILVFATTYYPDLGPAEQALFDLSQKMPDTEFHIITSKFKSGRPSLERVANNHIYRIGWGNVLDKYLLPFWGVFWAGKLYQKNKYRFVWSIMASYGGLAALFLKFFYKNLNFLLTFHENEIVKKNFWKAKITFPIYQAIFKRADYVYVSEMALEKGVRVIAAREVMGIPPNPKEFMSQVRDTYIDLINKQEKKLSRPK